ncbi:hypothetical protein [Jannaschia rubra]|uniref:hypothetical protein n=1 Tax=Jannaschia rubra TaxID=282197 RepID=UPI002493299A|nr:hypothetical protein [Jannaschia rubra]
MKYAFVQAHREEFGVRTMCRMPRIGFAAWNALKVDLPLSLIGLIGRLVDIENRTVARKLEERIDTLERQKLMLAEKAAKDVPSKGRLENCMELTLRFLSRLCNI